MQYVLLSTGVVSSRSFSRYSVTHIKTSTTTSVVVIHVDLSTSKSKLLLLYWKGKGNVGKNIVAWADSSLYVSQLTGYLVHPVVGCHYFLPVAEHHPRAPPPLASTKLYCCSLTFELVELISWKLLHRYFCIISRSWLSMKILGQRSRSLRQIMWPVHVLHQHSNTNRQKQPFHHA